MIDKTRTRPLLALAVGLGLALPCGCRRDARLADRKLRHPEVKAVTHYGVPLDKSASPEEVAYVLLRAIRDDFLAETDEERQRALDVQFDLCAAGELEARRPKVLSRDEFIYEVVYHWTPTVSHYVHDFETGWDQAKARFATARVKPAGEKTVSMTRCQVLMQVEDPSGDPNARAVLAILLVRDNGYWRVLGVAFDPRRRSLESRAGTEDEPGEIPSPSGR